jgi:hypothetical protein
MKEFAKSFLDFSMEGWYFCLINPKSLDYSFVKLTLSSFLGKIEYLFVWNQFALQVLSIKMNKKEFSERDICTKFITPAIINSGWDNLSQIREEVRIC